MQGTINWIDGVKFSAESGSGHAVTLEGPESYGGKNTGMRPMEMVLLGLGGCTAFDVMSILTKSRQSVTRCEAKLQAVRADEVPAVFTKINVHFLVGGSNLKEAAVERAVRLSAEKFCSASIMLERGGVEISHSFELVELSPAEDN